MLGYRLDPSPDGKSFRVSISTSEPETAMIQKYRVSMIPRNRDMIAFYNAMVMAGVEPKLKLIDEGTLAETLRKYHGRDALNHMRAGDDRRCTIAQPEEPASETGASASESKVQIGCDGLQTLMKKYKVMDVVTRHLPVFGSFLTLVRTAELTAMMREERTVVSGAAATYSVCSEDGYSILHSILQNKHGNVKLVMSPKDEATGRASLVASLKFDALLAGNPPEFLSSKTGTEVYKSVKASLDTIRNDYVRENSYLREKLERATVDARNSAMVSTLEIFRAYTSAGWEIKLPGEMMTSDCGVVAVYPKPIQVTHVAVAGSVIGLEGDKLKVIPIPSPYCDGMIMKDLVVYLRGSRIDGARGKGSHPHLNSGSVCIGDFSGKPIIEGCKLADALKTAYYHSMYGNSASGRIKDYIDNIRSGKIKLASPDESKASAVTGDPGSYTAETFITTGDVFSV